MKRNIILSKLKLLGITNPWQRFIISEISHISSTSGQTDKLFERVLEHVSQDQRINGKRKYSAALRALEKWQFIHTKDKKRGQRIYLEDSIWLQQDAILQSIYIATLSLAKNRRNDITSETILKEVRQKLRHGEVDLAHKTSRILVPYVLHKRCKWRALADELCPPAKSKNKRAVTYEIQEELF